MEKRCIREIAQRWLAESEGILDRETLRLYGWHMEQYVLPRFGEAEDITEEEVRQLLEELKEAGLSDNTVLAVHRVIRRVLEYGASVGLCGQPDHVPSGSVSTAYFKAFSLSFFLWLHYSIL